MAECRPTMMDPPVENPLRRVDSKFTLVTLAAKRDRQINGYFNQLGEALGTMVPPRAPSVGRKPLSIAFEAIAEGKITLRRIDGEAEDGDDALGHDDRGVTARADR